MSDLRRRARRTDFWQLMIGLLILSVAAMLAAGCSGPEATAPVAEVPPPVEVPPPAEVPPAVAVAQSGGGPSPPAAEGFAGYPVQCQEEWVDLATNLAPIAEGFERQNIMYDTTPLSDCSGMFHRLLRAFDEGCGGYSLPQPESCRDSRDVARWYQEKGLFTRVRDELGQVDWIKPGAVMFYGHSGKSYEAAADLDEILREVEHVGVVVSVERDATGDLTRYRLFHGRSPGKPAGITDYHLRVPARPEHRPFGNWDQQWVGVAPLADDSLRQPAAG